MIYAYLGIKQLGDLILVFLRWKFNKKRTENENKKERSYASLILLFFSLSAMFNCVLF